jgi:hypothetical protein
MLRETAMKNPTSYSNHDQNWHWPEKTWFRERLNALKERENEQRRKPIVGSTKTDPAIEKTADRDELKVD